jgi:hypothetical protein
MSECRFYEFSRRIHCAICGVELFWAKRTDVKDSYVLAHSENDCELAARAFYPPVLTLAEIKGQLVRDVSVSDFTRFIPDFAVTGCLCVMGCTVNSECPVHGIQPKGSL